MGQDPQNSPHEPNIAQRKASWKAASIFPKVDTQEVLTQTNIYDNLFTKQLVKNLRKKKKKAGGALDAQLSAEASSAAFSKPSASWGHRW